MKIGFATISIKSEAFRTQIFSLIDADIKIEFLLIVGFEKKEIKNSTKERILRKFYSILIPSVKLIKVKEKDSKLRKNNVFSELTDLQNRKVDDLLSSILKVRSDYINSEKTIKIIKEMSPELLICTSCGIIQEKLIKLEIPIINVHSSFLPKYKGMNCIEWALFNDDLIYCTYHRISKEIDGGDLLDQINIDSKERCLPNISVDELKKIYFFKAFLKFGNSLKKYINGKIDFQTQEENNLSQCYTMHPIFRDILQSRIDRSEL